MPKGGSELLIHLLDKIPENVQEPINLYRERIDSGKLIVASNIANLITYWGL